MKPIKTSFLYFLIVGSAFNICAYAQSSVDSLKYYSDLAIKPQNATDLKKAFDYFDKSFQIAIEENYKDKAINLLYYKCSLLYKNGAYDDSKEVAVKAIKLMNGMKPTSYHLSTRKSFYNLLGLIYIEQRNYTKAFEMYNNALESSETSEDSAKIYNNLSLVYKSIDNNKKAKDEILKAYKIIPRIKDTLTMALVIDNYGVLESEIDKEEGLKLLQRALKLRKTVNDKSTIYTSYSHLSEYYYKNDNLKKAKIYALRALEISDILKSSSYKNNALGLLMNLSDDKHAKSYKKLNDSLYKAEKEADNQFALMRYDYSEFERKAAESELVEKRALNRQLLFLILAILIAFIAVIVYIIQKSKHKKEKLQQVFDTESRISKRVHDDIANDVFQVMTTLQADNDLNQNIKDDIELIYDKARDISKQLGEIDLEGDYKTILNDLSLRYNTDHTSVIVKDVSKIAWDKISKAKKTALYKVLQELLINMRKHSEASVAVIAFNSKQKKTVINYSDDGIGCELKKSNGLLNVENRIIAVGGNITFESRINNGFKAKIEI